MALDQLPSQPLNIYSDSQYAVGVATVTETAILGNLNSDELFHLFQTFQKLIQQRTYPCFIGHIRAHSSLPGPLAQSSY